MKKNLLLCVITILVVSKSFSQNTWSQDGNINIGRTIYTSGGALGYAIRTNNGGGWAWQFVDYSSNSYFHVEYPTGNVGIGTTSPASRLHLSGLERTAFRMYRDGNTVKYLSFWQGTDGAVIDPIGTGVLHLGYDQATTTIVNGNLGIGSDDASTKLNVVADGQTGLKTSRSSSFSGPDINISRSVTATGVGNSTNIQLSDLGTGSYTILQNSAAGFQIFNFANTTWAERMRISPNGNVGIGTQSPDALLTVNGQIHATEVKVTTTVPTPDYVFEKSYELLPLNDVKSYIEKNKHLPEVPSASEIDKNGIQVGEMNMVLLRKVEELTLYILKQQEQIDALQKAIEKK